MSARQNQLIARYQRITEQLSELFKKNDDPIARMATISALLHHKMPHYFWTGFYRLQDGELVVGPYQGPLACAVLKAPDGVCWASVNKQASILVTDVEQFPGHVACDSRSRSEVVVPVQDNLGNIVAVMDVDSDKIEAFSDVDREGLEIIAALIYAS